MDFLAAVRDRFAAALVPLVDEPGEVDGYLAQIRPAGDPQFGDFQANLAMPLAKRLGRPPREVAAELVGRLEIGDLCDPPAVAGPGFINLRVRDDRLAEETGRLCGDDRLGVPPAAEPRTVTIDFSSPNIAKPMHVGHLRTTVIGDCLRRVLKFQGHDVIGDNHLGDWGTQFGMILYGYKHLRDAAAYEARPVRELARLYRLVNTLSDYHAARANLPTLTAAVSQRGGELAAAERDPLPEGKAAKAERKRRGKLRDAVAAAREQAEAAAAKVAAVDADANLSALAAAHPDVAERSRAEVVKLHDGDAENRRLWEEFIPPCLEALDGLYDRLGVEFEATYGESFYQPMLADVVDDLLAKGVAEESDGAAVIFVEGQPAPLVIRKSDGAFLYGTTDMATVKHHVEELGADRMLYVVDSRQSGHFAAVHDAARRWGYGGVEFEHVRFGTVLGEDRKPFKTRSGDTIGLESLLDEAVERAARIVAEGDDAKPDGPELDAAERADVAEAVGLGGIKYADLKHNRESDYVFAWDKMLATTGNTATYMQYTHARVAGIFRRGGVDREEVRGLTGPVPTDAPEERALAMQLNAFAGAVSDVGRNLRPNVLTEYLFDTAKAFSAFFEACPVLKAETPADREARLRLCDLTARVMRTGLELLGIRVVDRM